MDQTPLTYARIIERFLAWAQTQADIRAGVIIGSQAIKLTGNNGQSHE